MPLALAAAFIVPVWINVAAAAEPTVVAQELIDKGAQRLPADAVKALLTARSTVEVVAIASGRTRRWTHQADGGFVAVSHGVSGTQATGQGTWKVTDDGQYCVEITWKTTTEQWCRAVYRYGAATYLAPNDLARNADKRYGLLQVVGQQAVAASAVNLASTPPSQSSSGGQIASSIRPRSTAQKIEMIYFGGNDCPPCVAWRALELPKLRNEEVFHSVAFTHVYKTVMSTIPAETFLPDAIKPYKAKLDIASGQNRGSSQTAIMVDGEVFDYYYGTRSAQEIAQRLVAIRSGNGYPFERCLELRNGYNNVRAQCARPVPPS